MLASESFNESKGKLSVSLLMRQLNDILRYTCTVDQRSAILSWSDILVAWASKVELNIKQKPRILHELYKNT